MTTPLELMRRTPFKMGLVATSVKTLEGFDIDALEEMRDRPREGCLFILLGENGYEVSVYRYTEGRWRIRVNTDWVDAGKDTSANALEQAIAQRRRCLYYELPVEANTEPRPGDVYWRKDSQGRTRGKLKRVTSSGAWDYTELDLDGSAFGTLTLCYTDEEAEHFLRTPGVTWVVKDPTQYVPDGVQVRLQD